MKTKINRIIALLSIAVLCFGFTACTSTTDNKETTTTTTTAVAEVSAESVEIANSASSTASNESTSAVVANGTTAKAGTSTTAAVKNGTTAASTTTRKTSITTTKRTRTTTKKTTTSTTTSSKQYCYLSIECSAILDNMDNLKSGHDKYVPSDGYIIKNYKFEITGKEKVYDVLKEACKDNGIKLTAKKTSTGTRTEIYVQGINNLDEFDCGKYSGWIYRVNGIAPAKSSSMYTVSSGDRITWSYKC